MWWRDLLGQLRRGIDRGEQDGAPVNDLMRVMAVLLKTNAELSEFAIAERSHVAGLYPTLVRLEDQRWITSRWEWDVDDRVSLRRPRRRFYRATPLGAEAARPLLMKAGLYP